MNFSIHAVSKNQIPCFLIFRQYQYTSLDGWIVVVFWVNFGRKVVYLWAVFGSFLGF